MLFLTKLVVLGKSVYKNAFLSFENRQVQKSDRINSDRQSGSDQLGSTRINSDRLGSTRIKKKT